MSILTQLFEWARYDDEDYFNEDNYSDDEDAQSPESDDQELDIDCDEDDKRDPAHSRKRQLSPRSPGRPKLKRVMSNSERSMAYMGDFHVNDAKLTAVNMATPGEPDHTYSAVGFNIHAQPMGHVIRVKGFSVGGMLNRLRIYVCENTICHDVRENGDAWTKIYDRYHAKRSIEQKNVKVMFDEPVIIPPCENYAFYIHSDRQDDLGLKYRSTRRDEHITHNDTYIVITRGFAHTSPVPFNPHNGWFRENRVLSGDVYYDAIPIRWTNFSHDMFPEAFQEAVILVRYILIDCEDWHEHVVDNIIEYFTYDDFGQKQDPESFMLDVSRQMKRFGHNPYSDFW